MVEEMNHFLRANKIVDIKKDLALLDGNSCWTFCITYILSGHPLEVTAANGRPGSGTKVDYKDVLEPAAFERFSTLRKLRKQIADSEAIPAYAVFTDAELAEMSKPEELSLAALQNIPGIGKKKVEKYGAAFIQVKTDISNETDGTSDRADSES